MTALNGVRVKLNRKLKFNKKFVPAKVDAGDEIFANGIFLFNITKLTQFIKSNLDKFSIETVSISEHKKFKSENLDEATIQNANLSDPIILAEISPGQFNIVDGNHRLEKATRLNIDTLPGFRVLPDVHIQFLTTQKAYESYIHYWNDKLGD